MAIKETLKFSAQHFPYFNLPTFQIKVDLMGNSDRRKSLIIQMRQFPISFAQFNVLIFISGQVE
jgi:hypothetical protein